MKFKPGHDISFVTANGAVIVVKPFYTDGLNSGLKYELFTEDGIRVDCVDEARGIYSLGDAGPVVYLKNNPPSTMPDRPRQ